MMVSAITNAREIIFAQNLYPGIFISLGFSP